MIYTIVNIANIDIIDFSQVLESKDHLRYNLDGNEFIVKFEGETPSFLDGYTLYNKNEIKAFINNPANGWTDVLF